MLKNVMTWRVLQWGRFVALDILSQKRNNLTELLFYDFTVFMLSLALLHKGS